MESNPPLLLYWIATYSDDKVYPQFDPDDGHENLFKHIDQSRLKKFGLYPFNEKFANFMREKGVLAVSKSLPNYMLELEKDQRLIWTRRYAIRHFTYRVCKNCKEVWQLKKTAKRFEITIIQNEKPQKYFSAVCPSCSVQNDWVCPECKIALTMIGKKTSGKLYCTQCKREFEHNIVRYAGEERYYIYLLGWQSTINNRNVKSILFIDDEGNVTVSDNK